MFVDGIPIQRAVQTVADNAKMADGRASVADFRIADTLTSFAHAVEEVVPMGVALIEMDVVRAPLRADQIVGLRHQVAAIHAYTTFFADDFQTCLAGLRTAADHLRAVRIDVR